MSECNFKPCSLCYLPCNKARGTRPADKNELDYQKEKENFIKNGCPHDKKNSPN